MYTITQISRAKWLLSILLLIVLSHKSIGQTEPEYTATINSENVIEIVSPDPEVKSSYLADISGLGITTEQDAIIKFNRLTDNLVSFNLNWAEQTVTINLRIDTSNASWTKSDWNEYFFEKSKW